MDGGAKGERKKYSRKRQEKKKAAFVKTKARWTVTCQSSELDGDNVKNTE